jgi:hypothetical protein
MMKLVVLLACCIAAATAFVLPTSTRALPRSQQQLAKAQDDMSRAEPDSFVNKLSVAVMNSPLNQVIYEFHCLLTLSDDVIFVWFKAAYTIVACLYLQTSISTVVLWLAMKSSCHICLAYIYAQKHLYLRILAYHVSQ